ncbi:MAG TPA: ATP-binding protein [Flavipsychrobacter sp.]|nr:ATP-binding protein [Flavipsychrobacter sp.]
MAKIRSITPEQIIARMRLENPWWPTNGLFSPQSDLPRRLYFDRFFEMATQITVRRALVLMGPRRVGKTVMLHQLIKRLIEEGAPRRKVCFLSIDAPIYNNQGLEQLFALVRTAAGDDDPEGYTLIFDEIQYLKDWERHLKTMVDFFPNTRIIVSGSAAAALRLKSNESGAGRFTDFMLPPLTFQEYLHLKGLTHLVEDSTIETDAGEPKSIVSTSDFSTLNHHFHEYINYGGYPEVIFNEAIRDDPGRFIRSDIIDKVLLRDLPSLYGIRDVQELNSLFNVIAWNSGNEFNLEGLSQESGVDKVTIRKYLEYLEAAFLIKVLYPVNMNSRRFQRASRFKLFLTNPSMRCALFTPISAGDEQFGQMVETAIVAQYLHWSTFPYPLHYAAWNGGEVDLVAVDKPGKPVWAVEIKWSNQFYQHPGKLKSLLKYAAENKLNSVWTTTIDKQGFRQQAKVDMFFIAAACFCFAVGRTGLLNSGLSRINDRKMDL